MKYEHHFYVIALMAFLFTIICYQKHIQNFDILEFWAGVLLYSLIITPDLDHPKSKVSQLWNSVCLGFVFEPFQNFGHREALHHITWGPFIQIAPLWMIIEQVGVNLSMWFFIGGVVALEGHIWSDKGYSRYQKFRK